MDSLSAALGGRLNLEALLAAKEYVIADAIVGFWRCKTQFVPTPVLVTPPSRSLRN